MRSFLALVLAVVIPVTLWAATASRQHADTIVADKKILADDLNDEFDELISVINAIDSANVTDDSLTAQDFAATSSGVIADRKLGCRLAGASSIEGFKTINIETPCEIVIDGIRDVLTATTNVTLFGNLIDGPLAAKTFYFVYASMDVGSLVFHISATEPVKGTTRKSTDADSKYVGSVRTLDATEDMVVFKQYGNFFRFTFTGVTPDDIAVDGLTATPNNANSPVDITLEVPKHVDSLQLRYELFLDSNYPAECKVFYDDDTIPFSIVSTATGANQGLIPFPAPIDIVGVDAVLDSPEVLNVTNCAAGLDLKVRGWYDPPHFHK